MNSFIIILILVSSLSTSFADKKEFTHYLTDQRYFYCHDVLKLALEKSKDKYGPGKLVAYPEKNMSSARGLHNFEQGQIDVECLTYSPTRAKTIDFINPGILMGTLGFRILLIRQQDQEKFSHIKDMNEFVKRFTGGYVGTWGDIDVQHYNQVSLITTTTYPNLINMLKAKRFDFISRSIHEIWGEIDTYGANEKGDQILSDEKKLAWFYPQTSHIAIPKKNNGHKERFEYGLNKAYKDGSLKKLFIAYMKDKLEKANLSQRTVLKLKNPISDQWPDTSWWLPKEK